MVVFRALLSAALAALLSVAAPARSTTNAASQTEIPAARPAQNADAAQARQRRINQIIQDVEVAYQNGMSNYHDGHLASAKANFDYAVDQMLTCGLSIKDNPDLSAEFDRIVDAVNTLEMDALKQGNGLAPP